MGKYEVWDWGGDKPDGVLTTNDAGVITAYDGRDITVQEAVTFKQQVDDLQARNKFLKLVPVEGDSGEGEKAVEKSFDEVMAEARSNVRRRPGAVAKSDESTEVTFTGTGLISKADEEQQIVYGWAYVTHDREGNVVVDKSGDFVDEVEEIEKTAIRFMLNSRNTDTHHTNVKTGTIVESMVFTPEKIEKMGLPAGSIPLGWWIGTKVDDATWAEYKAGRLKAFSVHGKGTRKSVD